MPAMVSHEPAICGADNMIGGLSSVSGNFSASVEVDCGREAAGSAGSRDGRSAASKYGRAHSGRLGYRAGYYNRMLVTRVGHIELSVLQERQGRLRTEVFERYQRSDKASCSKVQSVPPQIAELVFRSSSKY